MTQAVREASRVQLPFEVELKHPTLGTVRSVVRDISESGLFVGLQGSTLKPGARVRVTVLNVALTEGSATPTIEMEVVRTAPDGMGLKFINHAARHLWHSVRRLREELDLGRDYFQVFQAALVTSPQRKLLLLQQSGRWLFPGQHLVVGQEWRTALTAFLESELAIESATFVETLEVDSSPDVMAPENATLSLFHHFKTASTRVRLREGSRFRHPRWVSRVLEVDELSFSHPLLLSIARETVRRIGDEST
jgi:hypothetical protein